MQNQCKVQESLTNSSVQSKKSMHSCELSRSGFYLSHYKGNGKKMRIIFQKELECLAILLNLTISYYFLQINDNCGMYPIK